jgi:hypothetical protein
VRAFDRTLANSGDPVTGSFNATLARWLIGEGLAASQGAVLGPRGSDLCGQGRRRPMDRRRRRRPHHRPGGLAADKTVPVEQSRRMYAALKATRTDVQLTELPGVDHASWDAAYQNPDIATWLFSQRRH